MAIKQRALMRLDVLESHMHNAMKEKGRTALRDAYNVLAELRDMYKEGLPSSNYPVYGEIYDGLIVAVQQLIVDKDIDSQQDVYLLCDELIQYIKKETEQEKHFKKEIVFLPYQAAMWDSLESVWKAAYEDKEQCNAYVMPIPYCVRNPDTSAFEWHCEREEFPKYVPTLDWKNVDLETWHPDVIFFHNPFDSQNHVTSVDSRYYSSNLKNITDKLVYIPYAVEEEIQPGNEAAETAIEHRVLCPGIINAHLVIAQSEDMRQAWINILMRRTNVKDRAYWEKHILGLGSPKIDKVLTSKREDFEMPEKWMKLVKGKKVILYITSISPTLANSDKVCDKLRYVFDVFRNRDDVVLWWRPHPLMKATFHSMRPQYEEEYLSIEKQYIEEGWGIYDDSSDLHRAICWSDVCYGDWSSVMVLYQATGKYILLQDLSGNPWAHYWFYSALQIKEMQFLVKPPEVDFLYLIDANSGRLLKEILLTENKVYSYGICRWNHCFMQCIDNQIIVYPYCSRNWYLYDMETEDVIQIYQGTKYGGFHFIGSVVHQKFIYFWNRAAQLWRYDSINRQIEKIGEWTEFQGVMGNIIFSDAGCVVGEILYIPLCHSGQILLINLSDYNAQTITVGGKNDRYVNITSDGKFLWLLKDIPEIDEYDVRNGNKNTYYLPYNKEIRNCVNTIPYFVYITYTCNHTLLIFPYCEHPDSSEVINLSLLTGKIQQTRSNTDGYIAVKRIKENCNIAFDIYKNCIDTYDDNGNFVHRCPIDVGNKWRHQWCKEYFRSGRKIATEKMNFCLQDFLGNIQNTDMESIQSVGMIGQRIYQRTAFL